MEREDAKDLTLSILVVVAVDIPLKIMKRLKEKE